VCRSSAHGGRRCSGSSNRARTRALNTAQRRVQRARHARDTATDPTTAAAAQERLAQAQQHLADTHAAHPAPAQGGDTTPATDTTEDTMTSPNQPPAGDDRQHHTADDSPNDTAGSEGTAGQGGDTTGNPPPFVATFVNYAAPGATVGQQIDAIGSGAFHRSNVRYTGNPIDVAAAHQAAAAAHEAARAATEHAAQHSGTHATTNTAQGNDHINAQVGAIYGDIHYHHD